MSPPMPVVDQLNIRFREGGPSHDVTRLGVLLHQFDGQEDPDRGWLPCTTWCTDFSDRFASSIINRRVPNLFDAAQSKPGGLIFRPSPQLNEIFCAWPADGGTMSIVCSPPGRSATCLPGCWTETPNWCTATQSWCPYPPDRTGEMLSMQERTNAHKYNEVIVSTSRYVEQLPHSLEAIFTLDMSDRHPREVHTRFLQETGLRKSDCPLLHLDLRNLDAPFTDIS